MYVKRGVSEAPCGVCEKPFDGRGKMTVYTLLGEDKGLLDTFKGNPDDLESGMQFFHVITLEEGGLVGTHPHTEDEEVYYILEGKARMIIDGEEVIVEKGEAINTRAGSEHSIESIAGEGPLTFIAIVADVMK